MRLLLSLIRGLFHAVTLHLALLTVLVAVPLVVCRPQASIPAHHAAVAHVGAVWPFLAADGRTRVSGIRDVGRYGDYYPGRDRRDVVAQDSRLFCQPPSGTSSITEQTAPRRLDRGPSP